MPCLAVRAVDLDHPDALPGEVTGEAGTIGAGALDTDQTDVTEPGQSRDQAAIAARRGLEGLDTEDAAVGIHRSGNTELGVVVDIAGDGDRGVLRDGHGHPVQSL
jgi:hypothetical protein